MKEKKNLFKIFLNVGGGVLSTSPMLLGIVFSIGLFNTFVPPQLIRKIFSGNIFSDTVIGSIAGSVVAGNPINSYIIGKQLLKDGVSLNAIIAFLVCWVTVGIVQLPYEISVMGKKFAFSRNLVSFVFAIFIAVLSTLILGVLS
jgi:uncharacterized membrane protein YraQ (UPF0718 family)